MITAHVPPFPTVDAKRTAPKITATLRNARRRSSGAWRDYDHLSGEIHGDTRMRFVDGEPITTSQILSVDGDVFTTRNSVYRVETWADAKPANDNAGGITEPAKPPAIVPQFDAMKSAQEALAIDISAKICAGARPDAVQILEWADALYQAEVGEPAEPVGGVVSPDERPGDYLTVAAPWALKPALAWRAPYYAPREPAADGCRPTPLDRYPDPVKAELVTFWTRGDKAIMSVVADGKSQDFEVPLNVLEAGARYAIERLALIAGAKVAA